MAWRRHAAARMQPGTRQGAERPHPNVGNMSTKDWKPVADPAFRGPLDYGTAASEVLPMCVLGQAGGGGCQYSTGTSTVAKRAAKVRGRHAIGGTTRCSCAAHSIGQLPKHELHSSLRCCRPATWQPAGVVDIASLSEHRGRRASSVERKGRLVFRRKTMSTGQGGGGSEHGGETNVSPAFSAADRSVAARIASELRRSSGFALRIEWAAAKVASLRKAGKPTTRDSIYRAALNENMKRVAQEALPKTLLSQSEALVCCACVGAHNSVAHHPPPLCCSWRAQSCCRFRCVDCLVGDTRARASLAAARQSIVNTCQPSTKQTNAQPRMLLLSLSDGHNRIMGLEYRELPQLRYELRPLCCTGSRQPG